MENRALLRKINFRNGTVEIQGKRYPMLDMDLPTVDPKNPTKLTEQEEYVITHLVKDFKQSEKLQNHVKFLFAKGSVYKIENGNLMFHGAVPLAKSGSFAVVTFENHGYAGRNLMDYCDSRARRGYYAPEGSHERQSGMDFLWYLWCGKSSPLYGRACMTTFERLFVADKSTYNEPKDPYYIFYNDTRMERAILAEFGLDQGTGHIINGHVPVRAVEGESPLKGGGRLIVIDGGFCRAYHEKTGIAGYTLVYNSWGLSLRVHEPFESTEDAVRNNRDITSRVDVIEPTAHRMLIEDTDRGKEMMATIEDLKMLLDAYRMGLIKQNELEETGLAGYSV